MDNKLRVKNCGFGIKERLDQLTCPQVWNELEQTKVDRVRFCKVCRRNVHHVITDKEIGRAIRQDQCIAWEVPADIREKHVSPKFVLGNPAAIGPISQQLLID